MAPPVAAPIVCPVLVGRASQVEALGDCLARVRGGRGQVLVVSGEARLGKSRLVAELEALALKQGFRILHGSCFEPDRAFPYAPLVDLLRTLFATRSVAVVEAASSCAAELAALLPELPARLPEIAPSAADGIELDRPRLFHAVARFFARLAATQPLLLTLEDAHWSDDASLELVRYLARGVPRSPILLALTYRSDEAHAGLAAALSELDRARLATEIALPQLSAPEVNLMLRAIFALPRPVGAEFLEAIHRLTEGNPFFVEEVLRALVASGGIFYAGGRWDSRPLAELRIPRSVRDAVHRRAARLSGPAGDLLALAAVVGRRFDFALLQALTRREDAELLSLIKELIDAQLVVEEAADRFAFRHALTREAISTGLLARERQALHGRVGETLERRQGPSTQGQAADLAYHFFEAGVWEKALAYGREAGEQARGLHAPRAAIEHFTRALEAARHLALPPDPGLLRLRGQAYETWGDFDRARLDYERALDAARAAGDGRAEWQSLLQLGFLWTGNEYERAGDLLRRAFDLARELGDPATLGHSLNRLGNWYLNAEQPGEGLRHHEEALAIFERLDDRRGMAETTDLLGVATHFDGDMLRSARLYERAAALFDELDDRRGLSSSLAMVTACGGSYQSNTVVWPPADPERLVRAGELALRAAREIGWRAGEAFTLRALGLYFGSRGEYGRALSDVQASVDLAAEIEHRQWLTAARGALGTILLDLLAPAEAAHHLEEALALAREIHAPVWIRSAASWLASAYAMQGELRRAEAVLDAALGPDRPAETLRQRQGRVTRAELALARGEPGAALEIVDQLIATAANAPGGRGLPRLSRLRGEALAALGRPTEAEVALRAARDDALANGARPLLWRAHLALGDLHRAQARHGEARDEFSAARLVVESLAATVSDGVLREQFRRRATTRMPPARPPPADPALRPALRGLTEREREVAVRVARGLTSRQIAEELVIAERTAERHVENILGKLGFNSRAQIAAWVVQEGLAAGTA